LALAVIYCPKISHFRRECFSFCLFVSPSSQRGSVILLTRRASPSCRLKLAKWFATRVAKTTRQKANQQWPSGRRIQRWPRHKHFECVRDKKRQLLIRTKYASEMIQCHFKRPTHAFLIFVSRGAFRSSFDDDIFCQIRTASM
jgi:hypothetical protein